MIDPFAVVVYTLCALTALACAVLLLRAYGASGVRLLLWGGVCFVGLTVNNVLLAVVVKNTPYCFQVGEAVSSMLPVTYVASTCPVIVSIWKTSIGSIPAPPQAVVRSTFWIQAANS